VIGREHFGVFPLKGKPLNVREASHTQIMNNTEIKSIIEIMGLQIGKSYDDEAAMKKLRYGRIMIMADQDQDGSHIKGLLINFVHHFWPSLLQKDGFLLEFITPIVKASKGKAIHTFFTLPEYESWCEEQTSLKGWAIKYYKGLGTSTAKEAKEYFSEMDDHQKAFEYTGDEDDTAIDMAFSKKKIEERKTWLRGFKPGTFLDHSVQKIPYSDFINQELILFSMADNVRSIPSMVDGFKPGQRKVLFSCFKKNLTKDIKVAQLAGYISEHSAYHHGEMSLNGTIVNMAQTHIGSNNVALLYPSGQFGTRLQGGKDSASPRYIFTRLQSVARMIFHPNDDNLLTTLEDDGQSIEPLWYLPIIPMVLVNGSDGIGTGWSSKVPTFNPREIIENLRLRMKGEPMTELLPWFRNFTGEIEVDAKKKDRFHVRGTCTKVDETTIEITELPVREWTQDYKVFLEGLLTGEEAPGVGVSKAKAAKAGPKAPSIKDFKEYHTDTTVKFVVSLSEEQMKAAETCGLSKKFKMDTTITTSNMVLFDSEGRLKKYSTANEIMDDFYTLRLSYYQKRKDWLAEKLTEEYTRLDNRVRFILALINDTLKIRNRPKAELLADLKSKGFTPFPKKVKAPVAGNTDDADDADEDAAPGASDYDYLLSMPFWSLTMEKVDDFKAKRAEKEAELDELLAQSPEDIWNLDLDALAEELDILDATHASDEKQGRRMAKEAQSAKGGKKKKKAKKAKKASAAWESDESMDEESDDDDWAPATKKTKKKAPAPKKAAVAPAVAKPLVRPRSPTKVAEEDAAIMSPAPKAAKKTANGAAARKKPAAKKKVVVPSDSESDGEEFMSLAERMALKEAAANGGGAAPAKRGGRAAAKKAVVYNDDSEEDDDDDDFDDMLEDVNDDDSEDDFVPSPVKKVPAKKKAPAKSKAKAAKKAMPAKKKKKAIVESEDDEEDDIFEFEEPAPKAKPKVKAKPKAKAKAKAPAKKKAAPAKKKKAVSDSEDDAFDSDVENAAPVPAAAAPAARPSRRTAATKATYTFDSDSEVDLEDEPSESEDFGEEDDGSDFDPDW